MTDIPTEALQAAARKLFEHDWMPDDPPWDEVGEADRDSYRDAVHAVVAAVAPYLIAVGRRQRDTETDKAIIEAVAEVDRQWCANIDAAGVDLELAVTETIAQLRAEVDRLRTLVRAVESYGIGYRWRRPDGPELILHPAEVDVFIADQAAEVVDETPALMARYERELRAKIAAEIRAEAQREIDTQGSWFWFVHGEAGLNSGGEWAARIAEGVDYG